MTQQAGDGRWLLGKTALVTGGGRGIGAVIARRLVAAGARVMISGRASTELTAMAAELGAVAHAADLASREATDGLVAAALAALGHVDILVNNAGLAESAPLAATSDEIWDRAMAINATAPFRLTRALAPAMVKAGWGRVIHIASNAGVTGYAYTSAYCAAKHALVGVTRSLALELGRTAVTINAICPGWVDTAMAARAVDGIARTTQRSADDARKALEAMSPQRRLIEPDEVAAMVLMLCREDARGIHGQALLLDGGQVLK